MTKIGNFKINKKVYDNQEAKKYVAKNLKEFSNI